jgi:aspartyl-tRNA(Asn)/glutamyl-tRNA(Gln) amidotransferase subunit A
MGVIGDFGPLEVGAYASKRFYGSFTDEGREYEAFSQGASETVAAELARLYTSKVGQGNKMKPEEEYAFDALTIPANLAEICAISMPIGKIEGIPVGMQVFCGKGEESKMFSISKKVEELNN